MVSNLALRLLSSTTLTTSAPTYPGPCTTAPIVAQLEQPTTAILIINFNRRPRERPRKR